MSSPKIANETSVKVKKERSRDPLVRQIDKEKVFRVYVWELPVRIFHWINVIAMLLLMVTGFYIGRPFVSAGIPEEAYYSFLMGWARYIHFFAAFAFTVNLAVRWYWVFIGNKHATSNPFRAIFWHEVWETLKFYLFIKNNKRHYIGHNPLAQLSYWIFIGFGSLAVMFTGYFMLFEPQPESFFGKFFAWVPFVFGGDSYTVRSAHHFVAWGFVLFIIIHVYMAWREDYLQRNGTMSSIVTGYKIETKHAIEEDSEHK